MLEKKDLLIEDFNYKKYLEESKLNKYFKLPFPTGEILHIKKAPNIDPNNNNIPFEVEFDDLIRLHKICIERKVTTILEFGVGKSTRIFADALRINSELHLKYTKDKLRRNNLYECHSVDNNFNWIKECKNMIPSQLIKKGFVQINYSELITDDFLGRICTYYDPLPNISPDLIYLDAPDQFSSKGEIRGISSRHPDRMPISADILAIEHYLQPGTLIIIDGRGANARFLKCNLQRNWEYLYLEEWDQHFFELQEKPLGPINKLMIDHCLGKSYYERIK